TDLRTDHAQTRLMPVNDATLPRMVETFGELEERAAAWFAREGIAPSARTVRRTVDMRYVGQNYELPVRFPDEPTGPPLWKALTDGCERAHAQMYGYIASEEPIQAVTFRLEAIGAVPHADIRSHPAVPAGAQPMPGGSREVWLAEARGFVACAVFDRDRLEHGHRIAGPAVIEQMDA